MRSWILYQLVDRNHTSFVKKNVFVLSDILIHNLYMALFYLLVSLTEMKTLKNLVRKYLALVRDRKVQKINI